MTDHADLISRLRSMLHNETIKDRFYAIADASDALEAQAKRIAELEAMLKLSADFASKQQSLGKEFEKILFDNLDELYVVDPALEKGDGII